MFACGVFKDIKMIHWENSPLIHGWEATTKYFNKLWTDRTAFSSREEGVRPFENAATLVNAR